MRGKNCSEEFVGNKQEQLFKVAVVTESGDVGCHSHRGLCYCTTLWEEEVEHPWFEAINQRSMQCQETSDYD